MTDYGAPASLVMQAKRTVEQEVMVTHVNSFEKQAMHIIKELGTQHRIDRHSLIMGRTFLRIGCMLLRRAATNDEDAL